MQSKDRQAEARTGAICFVANDFNYIVRNGGIGTYFWMACHLLAERGWRVHVLYASTYIEDPEAVVTVKKRLSKAGIGFSTMDEHDIPPHQALYTVDNWGNLTRAERVRYALEQLHAIHHFDLIEFAEWGATGFRAIQAKKAGLVFQDVKLMVKLHSSSQWCREGNHQWLGGIEDLRGDYCERYAFENADVQMAPCKYMLGYADSIHWNVRPDARVIGYGFPEGPKIFNPLTLEKPTEFVFFGRLETRKGLEIYVDACEKLPKEIKLTFLGKDTTLNNGKLASVWIAERLKGRDIQLLMKCNQEQALTYLRGDGRLAVMPSLADNFPYTVIECATQGIPFAASAVGGIPEMISDPVAQKNLLFKANSKDLAACLLAYLEATTEDRQDWHERVVECTNVQRNNDRLAGHYESLLPEATAFVVPTSDHQPLVTVGVSHYNLGEFLPAALASLAAQTYKNIEVIVVDDGSTCEKSKQIFAEQEQLYPNYQFVRQANGGCGVARNKSLELANGEMFVSLDADNLFKPNMIETFVHSMNRNPGSAAMTCYCLAFHEEADIKEEEYIYCYNPTGGPHLMATLENIYGDTNAIIRTQVLRDVGGFETDRDNMAWLDWMTYVKMVNAGHRVDVIPEVLFYYRVRKDSMLQTANGWSKEYNFKQALLNRHFAPTTKLAEVDQAQLLSTLISFRYSVEYYRCELNRLREQNEALNKRLGSARYRAADRLNNAVRHVPLLHTGIRSVLRFGLRTLRIFRKAS